MDIAEYIRKVQAGEIEYDKKEANKVTKECKRGSEPSSKNKIKEVGKEGVGEYTRKILGRNGDVVTYSSGIMEKQSYSKCPKYKAFSECSFADIANSGSIRVNIASHYMYYERTTEIQSDWFIGTVNPEYRVSLVTGYDVSVSIAKAVHCNDEDNVEKAMKGDIRYLVVTSNTSVKNELRQLAIVEVRKDTKKYKVILNNFLKKYKYVDAKGIENDIRAEVDKMIKFR